MTKEEFCRQFIERMVELSPFENFDNGQSVRSYAEETAPTYWEDRHQSSGDSPEDCVESDMSYWGEE